MALASTSIHTSITFRCHNHLSASHNSLHLRLVVGHSSTKNILPRLHVSRSTITFARRRNNQPASTSSSSKGKKIKSLAAELCLDRAVVLEFLRDPPPNLLLMSAALPDKPAPTISVPEPKSMEIVPAETTTEVAEAEGKAKVPIHAMQGQWSAQKRLKKVHVETLERVYNRSKRPTNTMISSIVQVTNLPRKRVVKWFEDKRAEDGVPICRLPYQRSSPETVFSSENIM